MEFRLIKEIGRNWTKENLEDLSRSFMLDPKLRKCFTRYLRRPRRALAPQQAVATTSVR